MRKAVKCYGFFVLTLLAILPAAAEEPFFTVSENRAAYVENAQKEAVSEDKLLLLVVGANWCHDSRALGAYLQHDDVQSAMSSYVLAKVDAAWLDNLSHILRPYGHPAYFGTPSVMIIEPQSNMLLNRDSMQRWQSAHNESPEALAAYLSDHATRAATLTYRQTLTAPAASLTAFETRHAERLYAAYAVLGRMLAQEKTGVLSESEALNAYWQEVASYRFQLQNDLSQLHREQNTADLRFPVYSPLSFL